MESLGVWKLSKQTKFFKAKVKEQIQKVKESIDSGSLLVQGNAEQLAREYAKAIGQIDGLQFLVEFLEGDSDDDDVGSVES